MDKPYADMSLPEKADWASGHMIVAIGANRFRSAVLDVIMCEITASYERGMKDGLKEAKENGKQKQKTNRKG